MSDDKKKGPSLVLGVLELEHHPDCPSYGTDEPCGDPGSSSAQDTWVPSASRGSPRPAGPSKVTTDAYRDGWDNIFGKVKPGAA